MSATVIVFLALFVFVALLGLFGSICATDCATARPNPVKR